MSKNNEERTTMKPFILRLSAGLLYFAFVFSATSVYAAAGGLDPTFGQGGRVVSSFGSPILVSNAALQSDGKVVVLISNDLSNFAVVRFLSNGSLDTNFGTGGFAQTIFANFNMPHSLEIQPDGKIVAAGIATNNEVTYEFAVARFNTDGSLDTTFGTGGQATTTVTGFLTESVSLIQPDGKILIAGSALISVRRPTQLAMVRYNPDGSLDSSFGNNGKLEEVSAASVPSALALDAAGNIFVEGANGITEFRHNGNLASQVIPATIVTSSHGGAGATAFQPNGSYVVAKTVAEGNVRRRDLDTQVMRFTANGAIDTTFNGPTFDFVGEGGNSNDDTTTAVAIQPNGKIVLGASHSSPAFTNEVFALARLNSNGSLDSSFGSGGIVTTNVGGVEGVATILLQPDGNIIAIGTANNFADVALVRYLGQ
jgi:uncharacterized delta-60 repeat protein